MQTLLVGLDAACESVLEPLFDADAVPTLESHLESAVSGPLRSQIPPWTASAWPSLYTGMNPGKHGVFDFLRFEGYDWDIVNATDVRERTLWEYLDDAGLTSVVVNAPVTSPPPEIDGAVVPGYLASEDPQCHPDGLLEDLRRELGEYRVYARAETDDTVDPERKFEEYVRLTELRGEAFQYLADRYDPEFGFVQFQKTDAVFHDFPGEREKVRQVYETVDEQLAAILESHDPDTVVIASDHGMGEYDGYEFRPNERLKREGFTSTEQGGADVPSWFQVKDERLVGGDDGADAGSPGLERLAAMAAKFGLTYQRGKRVLERLGLARVVGRHVPIGAVFAASEAVDFESSTAYLRSASELGVRLNVEGRDPSGVVAADEYEATREAVVETLAAVETPDGDPVFEEVCERERYIHGPYADEAVDVVCVPSEFRHSLSMLVGEEFVDPEPWNHKLEGIVSVSGTTVDEERSLDDAHLFDVAPTVLSTLGVAPDERMDGTTLSPVEGVDATSYPEYEVSDRDRTADDGVEQRLADLGYME